MKRSIELAKSVVTGLREQRRRSRDGGDGRPPARGPGRPLPRPGLDTLLVGGLLATAVPLALTGMTIFLIGTFSFAVLLWALEASETRGEQRPQVIIAAPPSVAPPHQPAAPYAPTAGSSGERRPSAPASARKRPRDAHGLDYEATLADLMALVGSTVRVEVAAVAERGHGATATTMRGTLEAGSVGEEDAGSGRGLFFAVGDGSGFFFPALDFLGAHRSGSELRIRLRSYTVAVDRADTQTSTSTAER